MPVLAQAGKLPPVRPVLDPRRRPRWFEILEVTKDDAKATKDAKSAGRIVPVNVRWKVVLPEGAKLISLNARLITKNTDGTQTRVEQLLPIDGLSGVINLPMPQNVFATAFQLAVAAEIAVDKFGKKITQNAAKNGVFPLARSGSNTK
jgi:hypothetical protein